MLTIKTCAVLSSLLLGVAWSSGVTDTIIDRIGMRATCLCPNQVDRILPRLIVKIEVEHPSSGFCEKTEIILTLEQNREVCLNPDSAQGRALLECWRSHDRDLEKTKACIRKKMTTG